MHGGILMALRRYVMYAKPWQQVLASAALVAGGVVLITFGLTVGFVATLFGLASCWQIWHTSRREVRGSQP